MTTTVTREAVLEAFKKLPKGTEISTFRLAMRLECTEYQVRAAVSWLVLGGQLREAGVVRRKDVKGRAYYVKYYVFTGNDEIYRVPRDPVDRQIAREERSAQSRSKLISQAWC